MTNAYEQQTFDVDWVVVGSGFGGSVSAMRLAEKGYSVLVLERGEHFRDASDMPKSSWDLRRYLYAPTLGLRGLFRLTFFKDALVMSGAGVGGGSLGYAMTLYVPPKAFFEDPQWAGLADWESELAPHYETAQRMLGVTDVVDDDPADQLLKRYGEQIGVGHTYRKARVGAYLSTRRVSRSPTRISQALGRDASAACAAGGACSGVRMGPRTARTRTTCTSRSGWVLGSRRAAR
jgi:cholesterol oxidase